MVDVHLEPVAAALADLDDEHLHALIETVNGVPQVAPGLLAWLEHVVDWEINRRRGVDFPLLPPDAAIPPEEDAVSLDAAMTLAASWASEEVRCRLHVHVPPGAAAAFPRWPRDRRVAAAHLADVCKSVIGIGAPAEAVASHSAYNTVYLYGITDHALRRAPPPL